MKVSIPNSKWLVILLFKLLCYAILGVSTGFWTNDDGLLGHYGGDSDSYILPAEYLLNHGVYAKPTQLLSSSTFGIDHILPQTQLQPYAGRMPGITAPYYLLRLVFDIQTSLNLLTCIYILLDVLSVYAFGHIVRSLTANDKAYSIATIVYALCPLVSVWNLHLIADGPGVSLLLLSIALLMPNANQGNLSVAISGVFYCWAVFCKPVLVIALPFLIIFLLMHQQPLRLWLRRGFGFLLPLMLIIGLWTARNYAHYHRWIVLQSDTYAEYQFAPATKALFDWVKSWGGDVVWWNDGAEIGYFMPQYHHSTPFPEACRCPAAYPDSVIQALIDPVFEEHNFSGLPTPRQEILAKQLTSMAIGYRHHCWFDYQFLSRIRLMKHFWFHSGIGHLFHQRMSNRPLIQQLLSIGYFCIYLLYVLGLAIGLPLAAYQMVRRAATPSQMNLHLMIVLLGLCLALAFPVIFRAVEWRYQAYSIPFGLMGVLHLYLAIYSRIEHILNKIPFIAQK